METKLFKAESKRLLELMVHSIYTQKEIFLRELISNSSDALDKLNFLSLTDNIGKVDNGALNIKIAINKDLRTLTLTDNGIGMTSVELEENLGTIAKSGSLNFKHEHHLDDKADIIGQFGVGFYSAFMVAKKIEVLSKSAYSNDAFLWVSDGIDGYSIETAEKAECGTVITLYIKDNIDEDNFDEFIDEMAIRELIKKYSNYIKYPILMDVEKTKKEDDKDVTYVETETLNSMTPIWKKSKNDLTAEDYENFYFEKHFGFDKPLTHIHYKQEGNVTYSALLYIPTKAPFDFYNKEYEKGLSLYSSGVMIMEKCKDLLPDCFAFVKGVVDSDDLSLNISRELLQQDRQLKFIAKKIKEKIKGELLSLLANDRDKYEDFYKAFSERIKYGVYENWGQDKETLQDLLMFHSFKESKLITLAEYVAKMKEEQAHIYFASGESIAKLNKLPQVEKLSDKDFDILFMTSSIDEFCISTLMNYKEKTFKSIQSADLTNEDITVVEDKDKDILAKMKEILAGKAKDVKMTTKLKTYPVCVSSEGEVTIEMEKVMAKMPRPEGIPEVKAEKILEINSNHKIYDKLKNADDEKLKILTNVLFNQALMIEGLAVDDISEYCNNIYELI